jgi:hypothetical protein
MAYSKQSSYLKTGSKSVRVDGYTKKDGTKVSGYSRGKPAR